MQAADILILRFNHANNFYEIKGLKILNFEIKNQYSPINYLSSRTWVSNLSTTSKHEVSIRLKGLYYNNTTQSLLFDMALGREVLMADLMISYGRKLSGNFIIDNYEIITDYDDETIFELLLSSSGELKSSSEDKGKVF